MRAVTAKEMQVLDQKAIQEFGIPSLLLMENAGRGVAGLISLEVVKNKCDHAKVVLFCGKGNNGGDGLVAARHLANQGFEVRIFLVADPGKLKDDPAIHCNIVSHMKIPLEIVDEKFDASQYHTALSEADFVIDALFGVGLEREVGEPYASAIRAMNESGKKILAVDIPSGLNADTGKVLGVCVKATWTAALGLPKIGCLKEEGEKYTGELNVLDIGLPREIL